MEEPTSNYSMLRSVLDKLMQIEHASANELELIAFELEHATSQTVSCLVERATKTRMEIA